MYRNIIALEEFQERLRYSCDYGAKEIRDWLVIQPIPYSLKTLVQIICIVRQRDNCLGEALSLERFSD